MLLYLCVLCLTTCCYRQQMGRKGDGGGKDGGGGGPGGGGVKQLKGKRTQSVRHCGLVGAAGQAEDGS